MAAFRRRDGCTATLSGAELAHMKAAAVIGALQPRLKFGELGIKGINFFQSSVLAFTFALTSRLCLQLHRLSKSARSLKHRLWK
jgi:hypothetical protein